MLVDGSIRIDWYPYIAIIGSYIYVQSRSLAASRDFFVFMEAPGAPSPATLSLLMPRSSPDGNWQPRPVEVEEIRPPSRVHQAHTVPGSFHGAQGSQPNVVYFHSFFLGANQTSRICSQFFLG